VPPTSQPLAAMPSIDDRPTRGDGILVVDKPTGWTSHDVVARVRRLAGTRRVGHAGTLDPMATGVLVVGVGRGTRLLGHLALTGKSYAATARLGTATTTDDAEGEVTARRPAGHLTAETVRAAAAGLVGRLDQVPSSVSAIKVDGERAYARVRRGEQVAIPARPVTVYALRVTDVRTDVPDVPDVEVDLEVECSSGTYVRALARDLGAVLGVGGHLVALRRTAVGPFTVAAASCLDALEDALEDDGLELLGLGAAASAALPHEVCSAGQALAVSHGRRLDLPGADGSVALIGTDGCLLAVYERRDGLARALTVFATS